MDSIDLNTWEHLFFFFIALFMLISLVAAIAIESAIAGISKALKEQESAALTY